MIFTFEVLLWLKDHNENKVVFLFYVFLATLLKLFTIYCCWYGKLLLMVYFCKLLLLTIVFLKQILLR